MIDDDPSYFSVILEAKLNSVPEIAQSSDPAPDPVKAESGNQLPRDGELSKVENANIETAVEVTHDVGNKAMFFMILFFIRSSAPNKKNSEDERYSKYFKMLKMGVPLQAVKNKMKQEGLDDSVLDNPDGSVIDSNDGGVKHNKDEEESSGGDESDSWDE